MLERDDAKRTGTDRHAIERDAIDVGIGRKQMLWKDDGRWNGRREEVGHEWRVRALEMNDDGVAVFPVDAANLIVGRSPEHVVVRVDHLLPRKNHVVGGERRAVLPRHSGPQVVDDREAVAADVAVLLTWDARREFGNELVAVAPVEEPAAPELREVVVDRLGS